MSTDWYGMRPRYFALLFLVLSPVLKAQETFGRTNTVVAFAEYSNDSSHIILGSTPNRKLSGIGGQYERRLVRSRYADLAYAAEFRPLIFSSDPVANSTIMGSFSYGGMTFPINQQMSSVVFRCIPGTVTTSYTNPNGNSSNYTDTTTCTRQTTIAQGGSPIGLRVSLRPGKRLQVTLSSNGGYMFATKAIPIPAAGAFNFTFNFGGGLEYYTSARRSVRLEYLVQHYSNHDTADANPGVDSGFVRLGYAFGR